MMRLAAFFWLTVAGIVALFLFHVKYEVQHLEDELQLTHRQIIEQQEAIHILEAEWSYLNRPERIGKLAQEHLDLQPAETKQLASLAVLPARPEDMGVDRPENARMLANGDPMTSSSDATEALSISAPAPLPRAKPRVFARAAVPEKTVKTQTAAATPAAKRSAQRSAREPAQSAASRPATTTVSARPLPAAVEATLASLRTMQ